MVQFKSDLTPANPPDLDIVEQEYLPIGVEEVKASPHSYCTAGMGKVSPVYSESSES